MCDRPFLIPNPYRGLSKIGLNYLHDTISAFIRVPCRVCPSCLALRQSYFVQRCQMESLSNDLFFCTLTYSNDMLPMRVVNGRSLNYPDWTDVQKMMKRIRKYNLFGSSFRYFAVSEYGGLRHRSHFHLIFSLPKIEGESYASKLSRSLSYHDMILSQWSRNVGSNRNPIYKPLCNFVSNRKGRNFDFHLIDSSSTSAGEADVAFYVSKYVLKASPYVESLKSALKLNLSPEDFITEWSYFKPRCNISKFWGDPFSPLVAKHIRKGIDLSVSDPSLLYPIFINPVSGVHVPLSPYYKKLYFNSTDAHVFWSRKSPEDDFLDVDLADINLKEKRFKYVFDELSKRSEDYNYLDF